jgi:alkylation response protein AidB-like acyl-CoA dehydrogenase
MIETPSTELVDSARGLRALLDEHADWNDHNGRLSETVVDALHKGGLFGMWVPRELGGSELDPMTSLKVIGELAYADAAVGWVVMATSVSIGTAGAYLGDEATEQIFGGGRLPVIAGQGSRPGTAVPTDGGHVLSGSWSFGSGLLHAGYVHSLGIVEGTDEPRIFVIPVEQATLIHNWDVMGLRATGSVDYTIDGVFVPEQFSHVAMIGSSRRGGNFYKLGLANIAGLGHTGWALGIGRRMLDELRALVQSKAGRAGAQAENPSFLEAYGQAEGNFRAARALVFEIWGDVTATLESGQSVPVDLDTAIRLGTIHVTRAAQEVSRFVYAASGTTGLRAGTIQRYFRDMHAGSQHVIPSQAVLEKVGRKLAGVADDKRWVAIDLVDA